MNYKSEKDWSFEQASAEQGSLSADRVQGPAEPIYRWFAMRKLDDCQAKYEATKSGLHVLKAVRICANHDLVMPDWLAKSFCRHYDQVQFCDTDSWDTAFGRPYKKGAHLSAMRSARLGRLVVHNRVCERLKLHPQISIDKALFESIANELPYSSSVVERYYYEAINKLGLHNPTKSRKF